MAREAINESFVDDRIELLCDEFGNVPVNCDTVEVAAEDFPQYVENARNGYVGSAYAWVTRNPKQAAERSKSHDGPVEDRQRALMILPRGESAWGLPGGGREDDESFERAATREVREEAGIDCEITGLWHLEHLRWRSQDDDRVSHTLHVYFDADYAGGSIAVQDSEVNGAAWFAEPPARLMDKTAMRATDFF